LEYLELELLLSVHGGKHSEAARVTEASVQPGANEDVG